MQHLVVRLRLESPLGTPLDSGTVFGHLCWWIRLHEGEPALQSFLEEQAHMPFLLSSGMPQGYLPVPVLKPEPGSSNAGETAASRLETMDQQKKLKRRVWIGVPAFLAARGGLDRASLSAVLAKDTPPGMGMDQRTAHNRIDRLTGTTPKQGGLYFLDEYWSSPEGGDCWEIYVRTNWPETRLSEAFTFLGQHGYGRDASLGRGRFSVSVAPPPPRLFEPVGNRKLSLSHGVLSENMLEARYKMKTTFGKLGSTYAVTGAPNKCPITLLLPGATFSASAEGVYGALLRDMHPVRREVVQNAFHLSVEFSERKQEDGHAA